jgi:hypothetical protein
MVRNESVRFGRHIDIKVSYKILQLKVPKLVPILHYPACFQKGLFGGSFEQKNIYLSGLFFSIFQFIHVCILCDIFTYSTLLLEV